MHFAHLEAHGVDVRTVYYAMIEGLAGCVVISDAMNMTSACLSAYPKQTVL
jgi:hypothetical protein